MADGTTAYAARLYETNCVTFYPDGMFSVSTGGWDSVLTADFILRVFQSMNPSYHGGGAIYALKARGKVWLCDRTTGPNYPIGKEPIEFSLHDKTLKTNKEMKIKVKRADRKATGDIYKSMQPFIDWMRTFIAMSDGWLMHETRLTVTALDINKSESALLPVGSPTGKYVIPECAPSGKKLPSALRLANRHTVWKHIAQDRKKEIIEWLSNLHEDDYLLTYVIFGSISSSGDYFNGGIRGASDTPSIRVAVEYPSKNVRYAPRYYDEKQDLTKLKRVIQAIVKSMDDCQKIIEVEPSNKFLNNIA
jgi:hypothetical protein